MVKMVPLEVTWTVEELLERKTLEDLLENLLLVGVDDDEDDDGDDDVEEKEEGHLGRLVGELALGGGGGGAVWEEERSMSRSETPGWRKI